MRLGIIGLPAAGKTTVFNALTGSEIPTGELSGIGRPEVHTAVVDVPDLRVDALSDRFRPRKTTRARVTYTDIGGLGAEAGRAGVPSSLLNQLQQVDAFLLVVRAFSDPSVPHPSGSVDPARDLTAMMAELLLNDMLVIERRLERLDEMRQKGGGDRTAIDREVRLFKRLEAKLSQEQPLRALEFSAEEDRLLSGFGLLTRKRGLAVMNLGESDALPQLELADTGVQVFHLKAKLEMEISQLPADERQDFLKVYGIDSPGRERVIRASHDLLNMVSFFTLNEDEIRAWNLPSGGTALEAAGLIHSDMARGFIRAEIIAWEDLIEVGGLAQARAEGKLRVEGKAYPIADGEVVYIRFNI